MGPLSTSRLRLLPLRPEHADAVVALFADPVTSAYLGADLSDTDAAAAMVRRRLAYDGPEELGHWVFVAATGRAAGEGAGQVVGLGHLRPSVELPGGLPEIGWYLDPRHGRRGLATEAAGALLRYGLEELGLSSVWALIHPENVASLRLAARLGFLPVGRGVHYGAEHVVQVALPDVPRGTDRP